MDGTSSVTIADPDTLTVSPLEMESDIPQASNFVAEQYTNEMNQQHKENFR